MIIADIPNRVHTGKIDNPFSGMSDEQLAEAITLVMATAKARMQDYLGITVETTADHAVGVDVGDLCAELDQRIGEPIERAVGRYLDKTITRHIRENVVRDLAEKIITYDRVVKESKA